MSHNRFPMASSVDADTNERLDQRSPPTSSGEKSKTSFFGKFKQIVRRPPKQKEPMATNRGDISGNINNASTRTTPYNLRSSSGRSIVAPQQSDQTATSVEHSLSSNDETLNLVKQLKSIVEQSLLSGCVVDETFIEQQVADIRAKNHRSQWNPEHWRTQLPEELKSCSTAVLKQTMAYGNEPHQLYTILEDKMNRESSTPARPDTSLANLKSSMETLKSQLERQQQPSNLFKAVLRIDGKEVTRADRMLFIEAQRLIPSLSGYTFEHAHDQVQAIRLAHYRSDSERELRVLIEDHRTFDQAYSYLQDLTRKQMENNARKVSPIRVPDGNFDHHRPSSAGQRPALTNEPYQSNSRTSLSRDSRPLSATPPVPPPGAPTRAAYGNSLYQYKTQ